jgi:hypothetical protein
VIWSEVAYTYTPAIGYMVAKTGMTFRDAAYTRPRTVACVTYPTPISGPLPACPKL